MTDIETLIFKNLHRYPGCSDRELVVLLSGQFSANKNINQICRSMASRNLIFRIKRSDGLIGNWLDAQPDSNDPPQISKLTLNDEMVEKRMRQALDRYLNALQWVYDPLNGLNRKSDIEARRGTQRWVIKVRGAVLGDPWLVRHFLAALGEVLQRMDDAECKYSIALPDIDLFRRMWEHLPDLAKTRTGISALFISGQGEVFESALN